MLYIVHTWIPSERQNKKYILTRADIKENQLHFVCLLHVCDPQPKLWNKATGGKGGNLLSFFYYDKIAHKAVVKENNI